MCYTLHCDNSIHYRRTFRKSTVSVKITSSNDRCILYRRSIRYAIFQYALSVIFIDTICHLSYLVVKLFSVEMSAKRGL